MQHVSELLSVPSVQATPNGADDAGVVRSSNVMADTVERRAELQATATAKAREAELQSAYLVADNRHRDENNALMGVLKTCANRDFAASAIYSKPVGGKEPVRGASIRLAEELCRRMGNFWVDHRAIYDDHSKRVVSVTVRDLETNAIYSKEIIIEKTVERRDARGRETVGQRVNTSGQIVHIVKATEDELQNKEMREASKAIRNSILRLIPQHIHAQAIDAARATMAANVRHDPEGGKKQLLATFSSLSVSAGELERHAGCVIDQMTPDDIASLLEIATAIKDGHTRWGDVVADREERGTAHTAPPTAPLPTKSVAERGFRAGDRSSHTRPGEPLPKTSSRGGKDDNTAPPFNRPSDDAMRSWDAMNFLVEQAMKTVAGRKAVDKTKGSYGIESLAELPPLQRKQFCDDLQGMLQ